MPSSSGSSKSADHGHTGDRRSNNPKSTHSDQPTRVPTSATNPALAPRRFRDRVRIVTLEAEISLLERERARLKEQVSRLEAEAGPLEAHPDTPDKFGAHGVQEVIDRYERIIAEKDDAYQHRVHETSHRVATTPLDALPLGNLTARVATWINRVRNTTK